MVAGCISVLYTSASVKRVPPFPRDVVGTPLTLPPVGQQDVATGTESDDDHERPELDLVLVTTGGWRGARTVRAVLLLRALLLAEEGGGRLCRDAAGG